MIKMDTQQLVTLPEASTLTRKSIVTIRRHILEKTLRAKKVRGKWCMNKQDVMTHFRVAGDGGPDPSVSGVSVDVLEILKAQLSTKDFQISELNERLREMNVMLHQKSQVAITVGDDMASVEDKDTKTKDKKRLKFSAIDYMVMFVVVVLLYLSFLMVFG